MTKFPRRDFLALQTAIGLSAFSSTVSAGEKKAPIRIGQIGTGHAHASKLSVYRASEDYEVVGIAEPDPVLRERAQSQATYADLPWMTPEQLLNVPGLQVVLVETEVHQLLDVAEQCIAAGKHIHLDKPAGESFPQFERILQNAEKQQLMVQLGYMYRYNPGIILLKHCLQQGWLGDVFEIHAVMSKVIPPGNRQQLASYPGGLMFELGCHLIDLVIGVLGKPEDMTSFSQHASQLDDSLVDNMLAVFSYPRAIASIKTSGMEVEGFARRHFVVCGTEGTFHIQPLDRPSARVAFSQPHGEYQKGYQDINFPNFQRYLADAADMAQVIRGEKQNDYPYDHELNVQRAVLQASGLSLDQTR
ncbi:MAG: Gfo/Idh/MocA family oxidoreductase [Planctomycetaceae bacterium]|nr:Gfo/Idh/MocA family oxidoreductase [Planctomycetaceae bacterium]